MFMDFCYPVGTKVSFMSVYHPQSDGVVEQANALIFMATKKNIRRQKEGQMGGSHAKGCV
jgi:hypothetical protein